MIERKSSLYYLGIPTQIKNDHSRISHVSGEMWKIREIKSKEKENTNILHMYTKWKKFPGP